MTAQSPSADRLIRPRQTMPAFVRTALVRQELMALYAARPAYQRNDYLMWINKAKREGTRLKRLQQMLGELARGGVYMRMAWSGGSGARSGPKNPQRAPAAGDTAKRTSRAAKKAKSRAKGRLTRKAGRI